MCIKDRCFFFFRIMKNIVFADSAELHCSLCQYYVGICIFIQEAKNKLFRFIISYHYPMTFRGINHTSCLSREVYRVQRLVPCDAY